MRARFALFLLLLSLTAPVGAQTATLLRDINAGPADVSPSLFGTGDFEPIAAGSHLFFNGASDRLSDSLWVSDGTPYGTHPLLNLYTGSQFSKPTPTGLLGDVLLFDSGPSTRALWRTDGTVPGTFALSALPASNYFSTPFAGKIVYEACPDVPTGCELWSTDGTVAGTQRIASLGGQLFHLTSTGSRIFAVVLGQQTGAYFLLTSDGTTAGTHPVGPLPANIQALFPSGDRVVFWTSFGPQGPSTLWGSDGTAAGTGLLATFGPDPGSSQSAVFALPLNGKVYFEADDGLHGIQIWRSDGTIAGTQRVTDLHGFKPDLYYEEAVLLGNRLLFHATDASGNGRLFATDGPPESTFQLSPVEVTSAILFVVNGRALFLGDDGVHGTEPWATDGTTAGTRLIKDVCPGACGVNAGSPFVPLLGAAFFSVGDQAKGADLWVTDGTAAGTRRYTDWSAFGTGPRPILLDPFVGAGGKIFFSAHETDQNTELWVSDGRSGGTRRLTDAASVPSSSPAELTALGNKLLFTACDGVTRAVWTSAGTAASTLPTADPGAAAPCDSQAVPRSLTAGPAGDAAVYFLAGAFGGSNLVLWRSDGTPTGASRVFAFPPALTSPPLLATADDGLWWSVETADGSQLWRARNGVPQPVFSLPPRIVDLQGLTVLGERAFYFATSGGVPDVFVTDALGTRQIGGNQEPVAADPSRPSPGFQALAGRVLFVSAGDSLFSGSAVWSTDGSVAGTVLLHHLDPNVSTAPVLAELGGATYFLEALTSGQTTLWRTDGTLAGTVPVTTLPVGPGTANPYPLIASGGRLFFSADDGVHGNELWKSDGTASGTGLVGDLLPGPDGSQPGGFLDVQGRLFFTATDGVHGTELWTSDGTAAGTRLVEDLAPAAASSAPSGLTVAGDHLYFSADDGLHGFEPWSLPLTGPTGCVPGDTRLCLEGGRFQVEIAWQDFAGHIGMGHTIPLTTDTGAFWFFDPANVEVIVKVLDARSLNDAFWVFYGALSNVRYSLTVTDTATGLTRRYDNLANQLASVGDTDGFGPAGAAEAATPKAAPSPAPLVSARTDAATAATVCVPSPQRLCLQGDRFAVTAVWKDFQGNTGTGTAVPLSGDTGYFWFFAPTNVEVVTKVLDGRALGGKFWFFYGALSNVEYTLTVTDTQTGAVKTYKNPSGQFGSVADTSAF